jgi:hypothetical protein
MFLVCHDITHSLTPWHYSPDGHKPPLIRFHSLIFSVFEEQVANLLPQHFFRISLIQQPEPSGSEAGEYHG